jgi:hypothetical protein
LQILGQPCEFYLFSLWHLSQGGLLTPTCAWRAGACPVVRFPWRIVAPGGAKLHAGDAVQLVLGPMFCDVPSLSAPAHKTDDARAPINPDAPGSATADVMFWWNTAMGGPNHTLAYGARRSAAAGVNSHGW